MRMREMIFLHRRIWKSELKMEFSIVLNAIHRKVWPIQGGKLCIVWNIYLLLSTGDNDDDDGNATTDVMRITRIIHMAMADAHPSKPQSLQYSQIDEIQIEEQKAN